MNGNIITLAVNLIQALAVLNGTGKIPSRINGNIRVISINLHAKRSCRICNHASDGAKTDDTKLFAHDLTACKLLLLLLSQLINILLVLLSLNPFDTTYNITGSKQHTGKNQFLDTICIGTRSVKYNNTILSAFLNRNIIHSGSSTGDHSNTFRQLHIMHFCTSYKNRLTAVNGIRIFISLIKNIQTLLGNRIQAMILKHYAFSSSNFFMNATSASTPSFGIAL